MADRDLRIQVLLSAMDKASGPIKAMREESRKAGAAIRSTRADIAKLEKAQADLKGFRSMKRGLQETGLKLTDAQRKVSRLAREIEQTDRPTAQLTREFGRAKREAAELGREFDRGQRELQETRDRLRDAGVSTSRLADDERRLARELKGANAQLERQKRHFVDLKRSEPERIARHQAGLRADQAIERDRLKAVQDTERDRIARSERWKDRARYGTGILGAAVAAGATVTGVDAVVENAQFESMLTDLAQKGNLSRPEKMALGTTLRRQGIPYGKLPSEMAGGVDRLMANGLDGDAARTMIVPITKTSAAYGTDMAALSDASFAAVSNLKIAADQTERILEIMAGGDERGAFGMEAMSQELPTLTAGYQALGQTGLKAFADIVAGLEMAKTAAGTESEAANNLNNLISKISSKETIANFKKFGVDLPAALEKAEREGKPPLQAIAELTDKVLQGDYRKITFLFNDEQARKALLPLMQKMEEYKKLRADIQNNPGIIDQQLAKRDEDTEARWNRLKAKWTSFEIDLGERIKPITNWVLDSGGLIVDNLSNQLAPTPPKAWIEAQLAARANAGQAQWPARQGPSQSMLIRKEGVEMAAEYQRQNAQKRQLYAQAFADQRTAGDRSIAEARRVQREIRNTFGNSAESQSWGRNLMLGLQSGMHTAAPGVMATIYAIGSRIKAAFKGDMQIRSPSRVFMGYGRYLTQGLALGIDAGGRDALSSMRRVSQSITYLPSATALARKAGAPGGSGAGGATIAISGPITISITAQPGQDGASIAQQIKAELARAAHAQVARRNSSYEDLD